MEAVVFRMLTSDSDGDSEGADTTLGSPIGRRGEDDEDEDEDEEEEEEGKRGEEEARGTRQEDAAQRNQLVLSPASQLHVLSQISELAEAREAEQREAVAETEAEAEAEAGRRRVEQQRRLWTPTVTLDHMARLQRQPPTKRKFPSAPVASRKTRKVGSGMGSVIAAEITHWEAFDDPILHGDEDESTWSFEELSDSDF